jgi:hypothetical protein
MGRESINLYLFNSNANIEKEVSAFDDKLDYYSAIYSTLFMAFESFNLSVMGVLEKDPLFVCSFLGFITAVIQYRIAAKSPRNERVPRLADTKTIYEFSFYFLLGFSWLLLRISPQSPISTFHQLDLFMAGFISALLLYVGLFTVIGKKTIAGTDNQELKDAELLLKLATRLPSIGHQTQRKIKMKRTN